MDFGRPHIQVRNPIQSSSSLPRVRKNLGRRRVFLHGQWHLLIVDARWRVVVDGAAVSSDDEPNKTDEVLKGLGGQRLSEVDVMIPDEKFNLKFDLGGLVEIDCSGGGEQDKWILSDFGVGRVVAYRGGNDYRVDKSQIYEAGGICEID